MDPDKLYFPREIQSVVGLCKNEISYLKQKGCPFFGRKTTIRWVRDFIAKEAGAPLSPLPHGHPQETAGCKSDALPPSSDSQDASPDSH